MSVIRFLAVSRGPLATAVVFASTVAQLLVATFATGLPQFADKGFGVRLAAYPVLMLLVPALWTLLRRTRPPASRDLLPWGGFTLIMLPFLVDVTGNTLNLYDTVDWWDDVNHLVNWFLLCAGIGVLLLRSRIAPPWALGLVITGIGAVLAVAWELGEWYTFIRHGTELTTAYEDTLGDEALGTVGAMLAAFLVVRSADPGRS